MLHLITVKPKVYFSSVLFSQLYILYRVRILFLHREIDFKWKKKVISETEVYFGLNRLDRSYASCIHTELHSARDL